jgi:hypothetical protein
MVAQLPAGWVPASVINPPAQPTGTLNSLSGVAPVNPMLAAVRAAQEARNAPDTQTPLAKCDLCRAETDLRMIGSPGYWCCNDLGGCEERYINVLIKTMPSTSSGSPKTWSQTADIEDLLRDCIESWCTFHKKMGAVDAQNFADDVIHKVDWSKTDRPEIAKLLANM